MSKAKSAKSTAALTSWGYNTLWCLAALGAIAYLAHLFTAPLMTSDSEQSALIAPQKALQITQKPEIINESKLAALQTTVGLTTHKIKQLSARYAGMQQRIETLEKATHRFQTKNTELTAKLEKLENNLGLVTGTLAQAKSKNKKPATTSKKQPGDIPLLQLATAALKDNQILSKNKNPLINEKQESDQKPKSPAGSIRDIPIPILLKRPHPTTPEITKTKFAITAGHYANLIEVKLAWQNLVKHHAKLFSNYKPHYNKLTINNEPRYQLITGPIANALDAARLCYHLRQNDIPCEHIVFKANPL